MSTREEFEEWYQQEETLYDIESAWLAWQHQQIKINDLTHEIAVMSQEMSDIYATLETL